MKSQVWLLLPLCFVTTVAAAQNLDTIRRKDADGREFIQVLESGNLQCEGYNINGLQDGIWTLYQPSKYPGELISYKAGKKEGTHLKIRGDGTVEYIEQYKNDLLEGPRRIYNARGPIAEEIWYSAGMKNGNYIRWYPSAYKQEEGRYLNDKRDGVLTWYYDNGNKIAAIYNYENGVLEGEVTAYHNNGKISEKGLYKNNVKTGDWKEYYEDGILKAEGKYINDEKDGAWKLYDEKGKLKETIRYRNGEIKK